MNRMSGSADAKKAWIFLRGPYLLAYVGYLALGVFYDTSRPSYVDNTWQWAATVLAILLISGSGSSWMVVSHYRPRDLWRKMETLEVTSLRVAGFVQLFYGLGNLLFLHELTVTGALAHVLLGLLFGGIYSNLSWHKIKTTDLRKRAEGAA